MKNKEPRPVKRKLLNSYFVSTLSITLLLFLIGLLSFMIFNAKYINDYIRENIGFTIVLDEQVREVDLLRLQKLLAVQPEVKSAVYVDAVTAAQELQSELGEDFVGFLGYNPLHASIDVKLYAAYTHNDSLAVLEHKFMEFSNVQEVYYQRNLVNLINENTNKIGLVLIILGGVMLFIFIALMNNTIRLSIYSKRFIINTMQLVGATRSFIRKPFVGNSVMQGIIGAFLANIFLFALVLSFNKNFSEVYSVSAINVIAPVIVIVFLFGVFISWLSTRFAVNKFLKLRYDELFY
ncbi:MAG: permease-like cell division protein FtsX [Prolixibacteraceae bacterium]|jgi:cell division transport system permease protein|nr:permease-like cell division protein FtsX [Prolixibacteraceae bacterium]